MPDSSPAPGPVVAIIGGGFSGAAVAYHLARSGSGYGIVVVEPRAVLGAGLAYSTAEPAHRINVPADRMTLDPDHEDQFARWLAQDVAARADGAAYLPDGRSFPARGMFGRYVVERLAPLIADGTIVHRRDRVETLRQAGDRWMVGTAAGESLLADIAVIATGHPPPAVPVALQPLRHDPRLVVDPWRPGALDGIGAEDTLLIVGTGLTMADMVASFDARGHRGRIIAVSRRGQRSRSHADGRVAAAAHFLTPPATTARGLLRRVRARVRDGAAAGEPWQAVFDTLRGEGATIWAGLPLAERRRIVRHLRPFWDTHRFRIAPQTAAVLDRRIANGTLDLLAASVIGAAATRDAIRTTLRRRGGCRVTADVDAVIVTTGPAHGHIVASQPFLAALAAAGLLAPDLTGLGLAVDADYRVLAPSGPHPALFVAGPLARGRVGELMGLPEITHQAVRVADRVARLRERR